MFFVAFLILLALGIVAIISAVHSAKDGKYDYKPTGKTWIISVFAGLFMAASIGALVSGIQHYSDNLRESHQSCLDNGGVIYEKDDVTACFKEYPVELQKL